MTNSANNVMVSITGAVYVGPTSAAAPNSATEPLDEAFASLGYVSADGVTFATDKSTNQIRAFQKNDLIREVITETTVTYEWSALETNETVIETYFGAAMDENGKVSFDPSSSGGRKSFVIDIVDGEKLIRHYIPAGEITNIMEQTFVNGEAITYGFTLTAYASGDRTVDIFNVTDSVS
jgi:hypothetical protein